MPVLAEKRANELEQKREALQKQLDQLSQELARALGPRSLRVILPELHSSNGRIDAKNLASFLGIRLAKLCSGLELTYGTVHKNPDSEAIQPVLRPVKRILEILYDCFRAPEVIRAWLNSVHPDLGICSDLLQFSENGSASTVMGGRHQAPWRPVYTKGELFFYLFGI